MCSIEEEAALLEAAGAFEPDGFARDAVEGDDDLEAMEPHVIVPGVAKNRPIPITKAARHVRAARLAELLGLRSAARYAESVEIPKPPRLPADLVESGTRVA